MIEAKNINSFNLTRCCDTVNVICIAFVEFCNYEIIEAENINSFDLTYGVIPNMHNII